MLMMVSGFQSGGEAIECNLYNVYNVGRLGGKVLVQYMVCRKSSYQNRANQREAENWGVPLLLGKSRHKHIVLYDKKASHRK